MIRKKIDSVYKELRPLSYSVQKKVTYHYSFKIGLVYFCLAITKLNPKLETWNFLLLFL